MDLDFHILLAKTDLDNQSCIEAALDKLGVTSYLGLQNVPGKYKKPYMCGNGTHKVIQELNAAIKEVAEGIPSIEDVPQDATEEPEEPKPAKPLVVQETPLADLELPGVPDSARKKLNKAGFITVGDVLKDKGKHLTEVSGIGDATKERIVSAVKAALEY